ncbi:MAG: dTDP-glucose 4,6-dehydratase [Desulfobacteraceae bacterium]|nr:MAG: dTDP-glucose 4,6-dehydratase [Desulfobacteraceae bacterium]
MPTLLVTGGAGFIGTNFIRHLLTVRPAWRLVNLDALTYAGNAANLDDLAARMPARYRFVLGDINDTDLLARILAEEKPQGVVHFAAESHVDRSIVGPLAFVDTNITGTARLLMICREAWEHDGRPSDFRFLHVSTDEVYGSLGPTGYFTETTAYDPSSPYSASKAASDHLVRAWHRTYNFPAMITNCSNNYGPYQFPEKLIPLMILNIIEKKELPVYGDGGNVRDWLYVIDHCEALTAVLERGKAGQTYNIGGGAERRNIDVVRQLCALLDQRLGRTANGQSSRLIRFVGDRPGHDRRYAIDAAKIKAELGWAPRFQFEEAMAATVDWYLAHREWIESIRSGEYRRWIASHYGSIDSAVG